MSNNKIITIGKKLKKDKESLVFDQEIIGESYGRKVTKSHR